MCEIKKIIEELSKSKIYIYKIKEKCYYISSTIFRECDNEETNLYTNYKEKLEDIKKQTYNLCVSDYKELVDFYNTMVFEKDLDVNDENMAEAETCIREFLSGLSEAEINDVLNQRKDFLLTIEYKNKIEMKEYIDNLKF